jgi:hypothetical protein
MIQEITRSNYLGFLCSRCNERIPVPTKTALLYEELGQSEESDSPGAKSRAFTLRCKACHEEGVYAVKEIQEFEGPPRGRASNSRRGASAA